MLMMYVCVFQFVEVRIMPTNSKYKVQTSIDLEK